MSADPTSKYDQFGLNYCTNVHDTYDTIAPSTASSPAPLAGRYVLVTGASKGIGKATAISFAKAGAAGVAILARSSLDAAVADIKAAAKSAGHAEPIIVTAKADVGNPADVQAAGAKVSQAFGGKLDVLVLNAGGMEPVKKMLDQDPSVWWNSVTIGLYGGFTCFHAFGPLLRNTANGLGTVIGVSSIGACLLGSGISALKISKLGLSRLMEHINAEYGEGAEGSEEAGKTPLLAYSIHPGAVDHPDRDDFPPGLHEMSIDKPELSADTTTWLVKERRQWLAGRFISVNWDMKEFEAKRKEIEARDLLKFRLAMGGEKGLES